MQVVKDWAGAPSTATIFVDANGAAPYDASTVATASGQSASFTYPVSTPVTVGETVVPTGYTATIDCGGGPQTYAGGPFPVTSPPEDGATLTCTITNTPQATVRVVKSWAGRPSSATIFVDGVGRAPYDVSTVAEADGGERLLRLSALDAGHARRDRSADRLPRLHRLRHGPAESPALRGGPYTVTSPPLRTGS